MNKLKAAESRIIKRE